MMRATWLTVRRNLNVAINLDKAGCLMLAEAAAGTVVSALKSKHDIRLNIEEASDIRFASGSRLPFRAVQRGIRQAFEAPGCYTQGAAHKP